MSRKVRGHLFRFWRGNRSAAADCGVHSGGMPPDAPWPQDAHGLLLDVLLSFHKMSRLEFRQSVLEEMGQSPLCQRVDRDVREDAEPRAHAKAILRTLASRADPYGALEALRGALRTQAPDDGALPWLELAVLSLTRPMSPLTSQDLVSVIGALRGMSSLPHPMDLSQYLIDSGKGQALFTGRETLPQILVRLTDRRDPDPRPLLRFLRAFSTDKDAPRHAELAVLREIISRWDDSVSGTTADTVAVDEATRLIVQIRLEAEDPPHVSDGRYSLHGACYRQALAGGPLTRVGTFGPSEPLAKSVLIGEGSAQLAGWSKLTRELRSADDHAVRLEFLLPSPLLGHAAELWSPGDTKRRLGHHHPVVVRSLERYKDAWLAPEPWRKRWSHLQNSDLADDVLSEITWPTLSAGQAPDLAQWLDAEPTIACLGLDVPYDALDPELREAVDDAMFTDGVPVLLWRRNHGDRSELVEALRAHATRCLTELPQIVHRCRRHGRNAAAEDVPNNITLLWEDPSCVDPDQDSLYVGTT